MILHLLSWLYLGERFLIPLQWDVSLPGAKFSSLSTVKVLGASGNDKRRNTVFGERIIQTSRSFYKERSDGFNEAVRLVTALCIIRTAVGGGRTFSPSRDTAITIKWTPRRTRISTALNYSVLQLSFFITHFHSALRWTLLFQSLIYDECSL